MNMELVVHYLFLHFPPYMAVYTHLQEDLKVNNFRKQMRHLAT